MPDDPKADVLTPEVYDIVQRDLEDGFSGIFSPLEEGFSRLDATAPAQGGPTAVVWQYRAVHDGDFLGLTPTGLPLLIEGVTMATYGKDGWQLTRYIDWLSVAGQLGLTLSGRPVLQTEPGG